MLRSRRLSRGSPCNAGVTVAHRGTRLGVLVMSEVAENSGE
jgi:hypothetical protein